MGFFAYHDHAEREEYRRENEDEAGNPVEGKDRREDGKGKEGGYRPLGKIARVIAFERLDALYDHFRDLSGMHPSESDGADSSETLDQIPAKRFLYDRRAIESSPLDGPGQEGAQGDGREKGGEKRSELAHPAAPHDRSVAYRDEEGGLAYEEDPRQLSERNRENQAATGALAALRQPGRFSSHGSVVYERWI